MLIVKIKGGLGNQLFQYNFAQRLEEATGQRVWLDCSYYRTTMVFSKRTMRELFLPRLFSSARILHNTIWPFYMITRLVRRSTLRSAFEKCGLRIYAEDVDMQCPIEVGVTVSQRGITFFDGYFQDVRFLDMTGNFLKRLREFTGPELEWVSSYLELLKAEHGEVVGLHVRRGDYLTSPDKHEVVGGDLLCEMIDKFKDAHFLVFSDDPDWCSSRLLGKNFTIFPSQDTLTSFLALAACRNKIIANSTFSWWAAVLGQTEGCMVVAPRIWNSLSSRSQNLLVSGWIAF